MNTGTRLQCLNMALEFYKDDPNACGEDVLRFAQDMSGFIDGVDFDFAPNQPDKSALARSPDLETGAK